MNNIYILNQSRFIKRDKRKIISLICKILNRTLKEEKVKEISLSIVLVDNKQIKQLNRRFLKRNRVTDVLAFPLEELNHKGTKSTKMKLNSLCPPCLCGEIIISVEKAYQEARLRKIHPHHEIVLYCVHGLLHLLGYDDHRPKDKKRMRARQEQILRKFLGGRGIIPVK